MNSTTEQTQTAAEARKAKAESTLTQLRSEREYIRTQQQTAQETIERVNGAIVTAGRSGEADTLRELRDDRRAAEDSIGDLERALPAVDRDIQVAEGELHMAARAVWAEEWNRLQVQQVEFLRTIEDAVHTIADALDQKERLAARQQTLVTNVCPGSTHNAALIRPDLIHVVTDRLQGNRGLSLRTVDWSTWPMTEQGDLLR